LVCGGSREGEEKDKQYSAVKAATVRFDTVRYDDGVSMTPFSGAQRGARLYVWFSPRTARPCSLVAIQYFFGDTSVTYDTILGFINLQHCYPNDGEPLESIGVEVDTFSMIPRPFGEPTTIDLRNFGGPIAVDTYDFFIGWMSLGYYLPIGLVDSAASHSPRRSYRWYVDTSGQQILTPLSFDLGVRAVFKCVSVEPDTSPFMVELHWDQPNTDLDLYLIILNDTIYWRNRRGNYGGMLDFDDNDGYGPEEIVQPIPPGIPADSLARIGVYYHGPQAGDTVKAEVVFRREGKQIDSAGWCSLTPMDWWSVAEINLRSGVIYKDTLCNITSKPMLSSLPK
jgi:hypothetical protein